MFDISKHISKSLKSTLRDIDIGLVFSTNDCAKCDIILGYDLEAKIERTGFVPRRRRNSQTELKIEDDIEGSIRRGQGEPKTHDKVSYRLEYHLTPQVETASERS